MMPELVKIGGLTLYTYGFMWVVGIWLAVWWDCAAPRAMASRPTTRSTSPSGAS